MVQVRKTVCASLALITVGAYPCLVQFSHYSHASLQSRLKYQARDCNDRHVTVMIDVHECSIKSSKIMSFIAEYNNVIA